jgi:hypothetical protein
MSKVEFVQKQNPKTHHLVARLAAEYRNPVEGEVEPLLMEFDDTRHHGTIHLYVIWQDWKPLDLRERSEVIMEAFEDARGPEQALRVSVAMGLTREEADRMGIKYKISQADQVGEPV